MNPPIRFLFILLLITVTSSFCQPVTEVGKGAEEFHQMFVDLKSMLVKSKYRDNVVLGGIERKQFVQWIRDHIHVTKAMKYFEEDIMSFWEFYMTTQTPEGLYYDYYYPLANNLSHRMNLFDQRYWRIFPAEQLQMHRLPVEADLEYLMVEGAYYIWQATGDKQFLQSRLAGLEKGMQYAMNDPLRWSKKYQLVKRGYTLDTWDFMQLPTTRDEYVRQGHDVQEGIFDIDESTPMGIMHGDNSGMFAACQQLSKMHAALGNSEQSEIWRLEGALFRERTNSLCWNGKYYAHFVEDDPMPDYLKIDQNNTLSLSNPYDINRGLPTHDMAASIIRTYQDLKASNNLFAFAEWFGIYPAVEPHFADYKPGSYMNGGVNTIVGGELAKAAFQHGFEAYGVDILRRMIALIKKHDGDLPVAYKPDGTVDEGIPDNWGQAAVMSALIEGLAGVVDQDQGFRRVEISPRWMAADKRDVVIAVTYGPSKKQVRYRYIHSPSHKTIKLQVEGDPGEYTLRFLLPKGVENATATVDSRSGNLAFEAIEQSHYAVIVVPQPGRHEVVVSY